jgi:hypothetical protein
MNRGQITIGIGLLWTTIMTTASVVGVYYTNQSGIAEKVNIAKTEINNNRVEDLQRIATLEEAVRTMKDNTTDIRNDVKSLLQFVGVKNKN